MTYNLLSERWVPVRDVQGHSHRIAPHELTREPWQGFAAPRPDFNGALAQFCIGLLQTACAPKTEKDWWAWFDAPPKPQELQDRFAPFVHAFNLDGDGPRFMQDFDSLDVDPNPIEWLLVDAAVENTIKENRDHFVKRNSIASVCPACAAMSLFTMQTHAPAGGPGYMTSLRGDSPMTTLILSENLWPTILLNVLTQRQFSIFPGNHAKAGHSDMFPWLAKTRVSKDKNKLAASIASVKVKTTPADVHPLQQFWGMPCRIRLDFDGAGKGDCSLCGRESATLVQHYRTDNYGIDYDQWEHVLSPSTRDPSGAVRPKRIPHGRIAYRHWLGLVESFSEDCQTQAIGHEPARVVWAHRNDRRRRKMGVRLWAFGYDMEKRKARCWYESEIPVVIVEDVHKEAFVASVLAAIRGAGMVVNALKLAVFRIRRGSVSVKEESGIVRITWEFEKEERKTAKRYDEAAQEFDSERERAANAKDTTTFVDLASSFWQSTEADFYRLLDELKKALEAGDQRETAHPAWYQALKGTALRLFHEHAESGVVQSGDMRALVHARNALERTLNGRKLRNDVLRLNVANNVKQGETYDGIPV